MFYSTLTNTPSCQLYCRPFQSYSMLQKYSIIGNGVNYLNGSTSDIVTIISKWWQRSMNFAKALFRAKWCGLRDFVMESLIALTGKYNPLK